MGTVSNFSDTLASAYSKWKHGRDDLTPVEMSLLYDFGLINRHDHDLELIVDLIDDRARIPEYSDADGDAGLDAFACLYDGNPLNGGKPIDSVILLPGETKLICLGFRVGIPRGWFLDIRPRSGISLNTPLRIVNSPGTIDGNYKGVVQAIVSNLSPLEYTNEGPYSVSEKGNKRGMYIIRTGDKICQLVPQRRNKAKLVLGNADSIGSDRGGGFGHSGV